MNSPSNANTSGLRDAWLADALSDPSYVDALRNRILESSEPELTTGCWLWTKKLNNGYGAISVGRADIGHKSLRSHRVSFFAFKGVAPCDLQVLHKCDTACCVNPDHVYQGTHRDNMDDKVRRQRGSKTHSSKRMSESDLALVYDLTKSVRSVSKQIGFSMSSIRSKRAALQQETQK